VITGVLLGFALMLLSMFFFYVARGACAIVARSSFVAGRFLSFFVLPTARPSRICLAPSLALRSLHALGAVHPV
jgi:hypothetical protein